MGSLSCGEYARAITVNEALDDVKSRFEGVRPLPLIVTKGCWMFCLDLQRGYQQFCCTERVMQMQGGRA